MAVGHAFQLRRGAAPAHAETRVRAFGTIRGCRMLQYVYPDAELFLADHTTTALRQQYVPLVKKTRSAVVCREPKQAFEKENFYFPIYLCRMVNINISPLRVLWAHLSGVCGAGRVRRPAAPFLLGGLRSRRAFPAESFSPGLQRRSHEGGGGQGKRGGERALTARVERRGDRSLCSPFGLSRLLVVWRATSSSDA